MGGGAGAVQFFNDRTLAARRSEIKIEMHTSQMFSIYLYIYAIGSVLITHKSSSSERAVWKLSQCLDRHHQGDDAMAVLDADE